MIKALYCLLVCFLLSGPAHALTLESFLTEIKQSYPPLLEARQKLLATNAKFLQKQGNFDTKLKSKLDSTPLGYYRQLSFDTVLEQATPWWGMTFFSAYRLGAGNFAVYDQKKQTLEFGEIRTGLELPLLRNRDIDPNRAEISIMQLQLAIAEFELFQKQLEVYEKALKTYWAWIAAHEKQRITKALFELAELRMRQLTNEVQAGKKPPIDLQENQRAVLSRQAKLLEQTQKQIEKSLDLNLFLSRSQQQSGTFPTQSFCGARNIEQSLTQAVLQRPETLILELQHEQKTVELRLAQNQWLPELDLYAAASQDLGSGDKNLQPFQIDTGLQFGFPLQQRKADGLIQQLQAELQQLEIRQDFLLNSIRNEIQIAHNNLIMSCQQIAVSRQEVITSQILVEAEKTRFELGASDLFILNLREQAAADAQTRLIDAQEAYFLAEGVYYLRLGLLPEQQSR